MKNRTDYNEILKERVSLIANCGIVAKYFNNEYPVEIIEIIVVYDGYPGLVACFPLETENENGDELIKDGKVYDIVQGISAEMKGKLKWIKDE